MLTVQMADNSMLKGLTVTNRATIGATAVVIGADGTTGAMILGNTAHVDAAAVSAQNANETIIRDNSLYAMAPGMFSQSYGVAASNSTNMMIAGNSFNVQGHPWAITDNAATNFAAGSTGNVLMVLGGCDAAGATGFVSFTDGTSCR